MKNLFALLLLALAACGGGGGPALPPYSPPPASVPVQPIPPAPIARPGTLVLTADWTAPIGAALKCGGPGLLSPFGCDLPPGAKWGVLPQEGNGGIACVDPEPNICFQPTNGWLNFVSAPGTGMALVSALTLDRTKPMSIRGMIHVDTMDCAQGVEYVGIGPYGGGEDDGDPTGNYAMEYISCFGGDPTIKLWMYRGGHPPNAEPLPNSPIIKLGETHELGVDWYPGDHIDYLLDKQIVFTEDASFGKSPLTFNHDPHPAIWFGSVTGAIGAFDVYAGP